jgi:peptide/nickel transport system substrate-binding protein
MTVDETTAYHRGAPPTPIGVGIPRIGHPFALAAMPNHSRRRFLEVIAGGAGGLALSGVLAGCQTGGGTTPGPPDRPSWTVALADNFGPFDPISATTIESVVLNYHLFEGLVDIDQTTREIYPALADGWPRALTPLRHRVTLRAGARFHDGTPVGARDVVFSVDRTRHAENSFFAQFIPYIDHAEAVDERTVDIVLSEPSGLLNQALTQIRVVPEHYVKVAGAAALAATPVGSGPYSFTDAQTNRSVRIRRAATYNGRRVAALEDVTFSIVTDSPVRISALRSHAVSAIESPSDFDLDVLRGAGFAVEQRPGMLMSFLMFNCGSEPFDDPRVRQALHYAIDTEAVVRLAFAGNAQVPTSYLPDGHPAHVAVRRRYDHDPARAKALLADAGHGDGLNFRLHVYNTAWNRAAATIVQQNWSEIGVHVEQFVGGENLYSDIYGGTYQAMMGIADQSVFGWDANTLLSWHYGQTWPEQLFYWSAPQRQQILDQLAAARASAGQTQQQAWTRVQEMIAEQVPLYPIAHRNVITAYDPHSFSSFQGLAVGGLDVRGAVPAGDIR